jgi:hypothetical protein
MKVLNIAAGKVLPLPFKDYITYKDVHGMITVNIDKYYFSDKKLKLVDELDVLVTESDSYNYSEDYYCNTDIFNYMERTKLFYDRVCIYRFLEHVKMRDVPYFIYLVSNVLLAGGIADIIVPDYKKLASMLITENIDTGFEANNILLTTEILNEPEDPHASIWTVDRIKYFWELEGRFVVEVIEPFTLDNRDIYLRAIVRRKDWL